jgi:hypothetical protein
MQIVYNVILVNSDYSDTIEVRLLLPFQRFSYYATTCCCIRNIEVSRSINLFSASIM